MYSAIDHHKYDKRWLKLCTERLEPAYNKFKAFIEENKPKQIAKPEEIVVKKPAIKPLMNCLHL